MIKTMIAWTIRTTLRPALSPYVPVRLQRLCSDAASMIVRSPRSYQAEYASIASVPTVQIDSRLALPECGVLYLHGGGYVVGSAKSHSKLAAWIGQTAKAQVYLPEYRLAPEHAFPAALDDAVAVYRELLANGHKADQLVLAGDSAGGGLTLSTAIAIRDAGLPLPAALVLFSPWVDLGLSGSTIKSHQSRDAMLTPDWIGWCAKQYCGVESTSHPGCSPLFANLAGLPPVLIHVGSEEILLADAERMAEQLQKAGVAVELKVYEGVGHVFQFHAGLLKEANHSIHQVGEFINRHIKAAVKIT